MRACTQFKKAVVRDFHSPARPFRVVAGAVGVKRTHFQPLARDPPPQERGVAAQERVVAAQVPVVVAQVPVVAAQLPVVAAQVPVVAAQLPVVADQKTQPEERLLLSPTRERPGVTSR